MFITSPIVRQSLVLSCIRDHGELVERIRLDTQTVPANLYTATATNTLSIGSTPVESWESFAIPPVPQHQHGTHIIIGSPL